MRHSAGRSCVGMGSHLVPPGGKELLVGRRKRPGQKPDLLRLSVRRLPFVLTGVPASNSQPAQTRGRNVGNCLNVENLATNITENQIAQAFAQDSRGVSSVVISADWMTGRPRAVVEMVTEADARAATAALDGTRLQGRTLRVTDSQEWRPVRKRRSS